MYINSISIYVDPNPFNVSTSTLTRLRPYPTYILSFPSSLSFSFYNFNYKTQHISAGKLPGHFLLITTYSLNLPWEFVVALVLESDDLRNCYGIFSHFTHGKELPRLQIMPNLQADCLISWSAMHYAVRTPESMVLSLESIFPVLW